MLTINNKFKDLLPPLTKEQILGLEQDILAHGCLEPLIIWNGTLIDGHHRYDICQKHGLTYEVKNMQFDSEMHAMYWCWSNQKNRRNLSKYELAAKALMFEDWFAGKAKERQGTRTDIVETLPQCEIGKTRDQVAEIAGISGRTIDKVKTIEAKASIEIKEKLRKQDISINKAYSDIKSGEKRTERINKIVEISKCNAELNTDKKYAVIYADPPWQYEHSKTDSRKIENQYPTMTLEDIKSLPVNNIALEDCILFLWTTSPKLTEAMEVITAWGFTYRTCAVWDKQKIGMGYYFRQQHELLLVAVKCNIPAPLPANRPSSIFSYPRGEHSKKPVEVYGMIESMYGELPKIELFARNKHNQNWHVWGNEV